MTEQPTAPEQATTEPEATQPSLESLYDEYQVQETQPPAVPTAPEPAPQPQPEPQPDVTDSAALLNEIRQFRQERAQILEQERLSAEEADLNNAIATIGKEAGLEGKDLMIIGFLIAKANKDSRLKVLWDKRHEKPGAWSKALGILASEVKREFQMPNPQLEENQRAMEQSQNGYSTDTPSPASKEQQVLNLNEADFGQFWQRLARRG